MKVQHTAVVRFGPGVQPIKRKRGSGIVPSNGPVQHTTVHPEVWALAMRLAGGRKSRLHVISPTEVDVLN